MTRPTFKCLNCGKENKVPKTWPKVCVCQYRNYADGKPGPQFPPRKPRARGANFKLMEEEAPPTIKEMGKDYIVSWYFWMKAGFPVRSDEEANKIRDICRGCDYYKDEHCQKCGCKVVNPTPLGDKPKWATEKCPVGKW